ncbi:MAG: hypothetical protein NVS1B2_03190 [Vulcanimicrobiaceae bacterium]
MQVMPLVPSRTTRIFPPGVIATTVAFLRGADGAADCALAIVSASDVAACVASGIAVIPAAIKEKAIQRIRMVHFR